MQHIGLRHETETGETIADFGASGFDVRLLAAAPTSSICLRFIDPYGDTVFNQLQIPVLIEEMHSLASESLDEGLRENANAALGFLRASCETHTYVRFVGD